MKDKAKLPEVNWGNYRKGEFIGDYINALPVDLPLREGLKKMSKWVDDLKKSENSGYR